MTFVDDSTSYSWVYFLKHKSEAMNAIKLFVQETGGYLKNAPKHMIRIWRSDNAKEFLSQAIQKFCNEHGIVHETSIPYNPEQMGVAERLNRTLMEMADSMRYHSGHPESFWAEAVATANFLRNQSPTTSLQETRFSGKTPHEALFGTRPSALKLRVFGCRCWALIPKEKRRKLHPKARKAIFIGYAPRQKGSKLLDIESKEIFTAIHVRFEEDTFTWNTESINLDRTNDDDDAPDTNIVLDSETDDDRASCTY